MIDLQMPCCRAAKHSGMLLNHDMISNVQANLPEEVQMMADVKIY